jgi:hypothetical protein
MNCPDCGTPVEKDAKFCPKCYARIEPPGLLRRVADFFQNATKPGVHVIKSERTTTITTVDADGNRHDYRSINEVPLSMRSEFEKMEVEANAQVKALSAEMAQTSSPPGIITQKSFFTFKIRDASGQERVYHSLEELPPEVQETMKRLRGPASPAPSQGKTIEVRAVWAPRSASIPMFLIAVILFIVAVVVVWFLRKAGP